MFSDPQIRPFNADATKNMRGLNPEDIDRLVTVSGSSLRCVASTSPRARPARRRVAREDRRATCYVRVPVL
jgi:hypothetical protein